MADKNNAYIIHYPLKNQHDEALETSPKDSPLTFYPGDGSVLKIIESPSYLQMGTKN